MQEKTERVVILTQCPHNFIEVVGLSDEEEDNLYAHFERKFGASRVSTWTLKPYRIKLEEITGAGLSVLITEYCKSNQIRISTSE